MILFKKLPILLLLLTGSILYGSNLYGQTVSIDITTLPGLQFDKVQLAVKPDDDVTLTFYNADDMSHNLLIVKPGKRSHVVEAAMALAEKGPEKGYIPDSKDILWHIPVLSPGEKKSIRFKAPSLPGAYPFVCTYPGHGFVMYGVIHVSGNLSIPPLEQDPDVPDSRKSSGGNSTAGQHQDHAPGQHPYELTPPYLYRAFMEGSSLASIAVRLPGQLAFCWDAQQCRLRFAWAGEFVDNKDFWHGHKNAYAKVLGEIFYSDSQQHPLRIGNRNLIPSVKFRGYRLVDRYPEFSYLVNGLEVFELIREKPDGSGLERQFRITNGLEPVWFVYGKNDGVSCTVSQGKTDTDGAFSLSPQQATKFTITMTRVAP